MTSIKSIRIAGFRSLKDVTLEPGRVTVLIGANGAGKSNVLSALRMLRAMADQGLRWYVAEAGAAATLLHYGPKQTPAMELEVDFEDDGGRFAYVARLGHAADDTLAFLDERLDDRVADNATQSLGTGHREARLGAEARTGAFAARSAYQSLAGLGTFHFHDTSGHSPLRQHSRQEDARRLHPDGSNLAAYLYMIANATGESYRKAWDFINSMVNRIAPFIERLDPVLATPDQRETSMVRLDWFDETGYPFRTHHLSDGTLRMIALVTALVQPIELRPAFIAIDEPELGLHPAAISLLAGLIRSASAHSQILIATQSPMLLNEFAPADVVVVERELNATVLHRLDPDKLATWFEDYTLAEIWEKNLIGGRP
jgi:predicted ATPase